MIDRDQNMRYKAVVCLCRHVTGHRAIAMKPLVCVGCNLIQTNLCSELRLETSVQGCSKAGVRAEGSSSFL